MQSCNSVYRSVCELSELFLHYILPSSSLPTFPTFPSSPYLPYLPYLSLPSLPSSLSPIYSASTQEEARRHSIDVLQILKRRSDGWSGLGMSGDPVTTRLKEGRKSAQRKQEDIEVRFYASIALWMYCNITNPMVAKWSKYCIEENFCGRKLANCSLVSPKDAVPPNFEERSFVDSHKTLIFTNV